MISEKDISTIEEFLNGSLSEEARKTVEKRVSTDVDFAEKVRLLRDMPLAIGTDVAGFRKDLKSILQEENTIKKPVSRSLNLRWKIAASIAILVGLMWIFFPRSSTQDLFASHFEVPEENLSVRNNDGLDENLQAAIVFYNDRNYASAEESFNAFLVNSPDRSDAVFFKAVSQMLQDKHDQSRVAFDQVISSSTTFKNAAIWYKGLSYLDEGITEDAKKTLSQLVEQGNNRYAARAQEIIEKLD